MAVPVKLFFSLHHKYSYTIFFALFSTRYQLARCTQNSLRHVVPKLNYSRRLSYDRSYSHLRESSILRFENNHRHRCITVNGKRYSKCEQLWRIWRKTRDNFLRETGRQNVENYKNLNKKRNGRASDYVRLEHGYQPVTNKYG